MEPIEEKDFEPNMINKNPIEKLEEKIAEQNAELVRVREALRKVCTFGELNFLLVTNESEQSEDLEQALDRCADFLTFGALYKCQKCLKGDMVFNKTGYFCNEMISEWVKCGNFEQHPMRLKCFIPNELKHKSFFATCEPIVANRALRPITKLNPNDSEIDPIHSPRVLKKAKQAKVTKITLKEGTVVDPKSELGSATHVYRKDGVLYSSVLGLTDIEKNKNSYYKLQVLEPDGLHGYCFLFTSWGRIGTEIGDWKVEDCTSVEEACIKFEEIYKQQTGNAWGAKAFKKWPGKFYPVDVNYNEEITENISTKSKLSPEVEELMKVLFNIQTMKNVMKQFQLDLEKMPLGKLSMNQLNLAEDTLEEIEEAITAAKPHIELVGLSNKFFTLVPHSFGLGKVPVINTIEMVNEKREMIDNLFDIALAYNMMTDAAGTNLNSFDAYYKQLKADIEFLPEDSEEFHLIQEYFNNTDVHGLNLTHLEVFKVKREGEDDRYQQFQSLQNRKLLWHGSQITNFASIITNGLKITTQVNGSMFGRGLYFADMVSKSANYCFGPTRIPTPGVHMLALCEVALGNIIKYSNAQNIDRPPPGFDSVMGRGLQEPDPKMSHIRADGVEIPLGLPSRAFLYSLAGLRYNEFIVYNEAQVKMQYLVKFKYR